MSHWFGMVGERPRSVKPLRFGRNRIAIWDELTRRFESKLILAKCQEEGIPESIVKTHASTVSAGLEAPIREWFAGLPEAKARGYGPGRFSFNTAGGRCSECEGQGQLTVAMSFLPDVKVPCERCGGRRFDASTLEATWRGRSIADVLAMSVEDALGFFESHARIRAPLQLLADVGLGYLQLGQASPTLSGGEAQRIKLVTELARLRPIRGGSATQTLYVLDEPTVGLHMADVERLTATLHRLVDAGHSVVMVEHNLDLIAEADWVIDLGPEAGDRGGRLVAEGPPSRIAARAGRSHTGAALAPFLRARAG